MPDRSSSRPILLRNATPATNRGVANFACPLKLASWADVDALADYQYMIRKPLCLICDDAELLEAGLRAYQGRALYEGNLTEDALAPLVEKYGLLV